MRTTESALSRYVVHYTAERVKSKRGDLGWSMTELAGYSGLTTPTVSRIERELSGVPSAETILRLALAFDCSPAELMPTVMETVHHLQVAV